MKVIITSLPEKLPAEVRELLDPARPLPAGARFFEERVNVAGLARIVGSAGLLAILGALLAAFGVYVFVDSTRFVSVNSKVDFVLIGVGAVMLFAAYLLMASLGRRRKIMIQQRAGVATRYGIFLAGDLLVAHSVLDTTVIPRPLWKGLQAGAVTYDLDGVVKSFDLPAEVVGADRGAVETAITAWSAGA